MEDLGRRTALETQNALEAKIGNFADLKNIPLAITISRGHKNRGSSTSIDREFQGGLNDMSCAALKLTFAMSGAFFIFNNTFFGYYYSTR